MELHLRKITRCLGAAVEELERVSTSEKAAREVDAAWMTRFHEDITIPAPPEAPDIKKAHQTADPVTSRLDVARNNVEETEFDVDASAEGGNCDLRWNFVRSKWVPLLRDLHRTVHVLDIEESALQKAEEEKNSSETCEGREAATVGSARQDRARPRPPKGLLSLRDYTVIHSALEIVVHWGLSPALEPGVGVFDADKRPRSRAVKLSRRVLQWGRGDGGGGSATGEMLGASERQRPSSPFSTSNGHIDRCDNHHDGGDYRSSAGVAAVRLAMCADAIQGVVFTQQFMPMLMPLYLPDLLAVRLQLAYGRGAVGAAVTPAAAVLNGIPTKNANETAAVREGCYNSIRNGTGQVPEVAQVRRQQPTAARDADSTTTTITAANRPSRKSLDVHDTERQDKIAQKRKQREDSLRALLRDVGPRQVMGALRQLLSQGSRAPPWLRQRGGRILSQIVLRPGGVQATLEVYLAGAGGGEGGEEREEMRACLRVSRLLAAPPKSVSAGEYVSRVAPQLAEMLHYNGQQRAVITRVVVMIIGRLSESMPQDMKRLVLVPLLEPLSLFWGPRSGNVARRRRPVSSEKLDSESGGGSSKTKSTTTPTPIVAVGGGGASGETLLNKGECGSEGEGRSDDGQIASEESLDRCVEDLEKLLTAAPARPSLMGLLSKMGVLVPVFRLHCFCKTARSRGLQSTQRSLSALLSSSPTAARDLVTGLLPTKTRWDGDTIGREARFCPGPTGGAVLRRHTHSRRRQMEGNSSGSALGSITESGDETRVTGTYPSRDDSLLGLEEALDGLGLDPETLRMIGMGNEASGTAMGDRSSGGNGGFHDALAGLKEAESRAQCAAGLLEELGEESPVAGQVFDILLRRYLSLRDRLVVSPEASSSSSTPLPVRKRSDESGTGVSLSAERDTNAAAEMTNAETSDASLTGALSESIGEESHAVMAAVVVLAEKLGARVFGTGVQMLSCIRLVLEHERPTAGNGGGTGGGSVIDAAGKVPQMERDQAEGGIMTGTREGLGLGGLGVAEDGDEDPESDTLCSVVLGLLTTVVELGEEERSPEEEEELRAMLGPLQALAAGHRNTEVSEMSAMLSASILSRGLTPEQRREERERFKGAIDLGSGCGGGGEPSGEVRTARMLAALDAAEEDLRSDAVPMRARGVISLTRLMRATSGIIGTAAVNMDTAVAQRLLDTYARMAGDADSYVYLAAVQGLASLADTLPGWCIPRLVGLFAALPTSTTLYPPHQEAPIAESRTTVAAAAAATPLTLSQRLKIGEAVVLSARRCGEAMPKYAHYYVNAFVSAARERPDGGTRASSPAPVTDESQLESKERSHFRASCLSNLAEVCQLLRWSLGRFSQDIVDLGSGVLSMETGPSEEATLARRGAAFLLGRLLGGAERELLQILPPDQLRTAYRVLKRTADKDHDHITRSHARIGLSCLDVAIRSQLFPGSYRDASGDVAGAASVISRMAAADEREDSWERSSSTGHTGIALL